MRVFTEKLTDDGVTLTAYLPDYSEEMKHMAKRPTMLVIPGGAYMFCSDREAEHERYFFLPLRDCASQ